MTVTSDSPALADGRTRRREYGWSDPQILTRPGSRSGLETIAYFHQQGIESPMNSTLGIELVEIAEGRIVLQFQPQEWHYNVIGMVHGGMVCTIADTAMAMAVHSSLETGLVPTTTDNQTRFYRAIKQDAGPVRCIGQVTHLGRRTAAAKADLIDDAGRLLAQASTSCLIISR
ncbi:PaaI family thioesterase [Mycolicibacterium sp. lyk4-40-TYG-92]|uniref:PaaI family thioesterase n=1 Tax=Mycolicibacterium sp. lyk4-40-TYG-92 TaxID=3040295 RepID=UPI00254FFCD3|nr:PaaI family thioesterase [Mycolicibacterium sp. lyk4-40-TYG-92]